MNLRLLAKQLGILSALIGGFMIFSLPWSLVGVGRNAQFEKTGFIALVASIIVCFLLGFLLYRYGKQGAGKLYRKEAMAVVGLSWVLATFLGALPFYLSGTLRGPSLRFDEQSTQPLLVSQGTQLFHVWDRGPDLNDQQIELLKVLHDCPRPSVGLSLSKIRQTSGIDNAAEVLRQLNQNEDWDAYLLVPGEGSTTADRVNNYRIRWVRMTICDAMFESQSGFSTTGASVMSELEDPQAIASCIHFWRASTHFLGGLGIIVLFVILLGQGSAGKALMRTEVPGVSSDSTSARMQHSAWRFAGIYVVLNITLIFTLLILGMGPFDAICHAFGTMATGGFSTYNGSLGHFNNPAIEYVVIVFMIMAGTNFTLLYFCILRQPGRLFADVEWRTYIFIIVGITATIVIFGWQNSDSGFESFEPAFRNGLFQVVSVITTTGFGTNDFDSWNQFGRLLILLLMFVGGCAGSTGGGMKVIRHLLLVKILWLQTEKSFHPRVIKPLRVQGDNEIDETELKHSILSYFAIVALLFATSWLLIAAIEPTTAWNGGPSNKLLDSASSVVATLNNIGPGLGTVGPTSNFGNFTGITKLFFVFLMMLGRLEIWPVLVLFAPKFWKNR